MKLDNNIKDSKYRIILEGCDGVGKTTLMAKLEQFINADVMTIHFTAPPKNCDRVHWTQFNFENIIRYIGNFSTNNLIIDRAYLSEAVYREKYNPNIEPYDYSNVDLFMTNKKFIMIYVDIKDTDVLVNRISERKDWLIKDNILETVTDIRNLYNKHLENVKIPYFKYYSDDNSLEQYNNLLSFITKGSN